MKAVHQLKPENVTLKLTCRHINRRHICFNIKSISVNPLLWMNVMQYFLIKQYYKNYVSYIIWLYIIFILFLFIIVYIVCIIIYLLILYIGIS